MSCDLLSHALFDTDHRCVRRTRRAGILALCAAWFAVALLGTVPSAFAQDSASVEDSSAVDSVLAGSVAADRAALVERLEERYEVLSLRRGGFVLEPREKKVGFRAIEIAPGRVWVDGVEVDEDDLRRFVDGDASLILELTLAPEGMEPPRPPLPRPPLPRPPSPGSVDLDAIEEEVERALEEVDAQRIRELEVLEDARRRARDELRRAREREREVRDEIRETMRDGLREGMRDGMRRGDAKVAISSSVAVEADEIVDEVVVIMGSADIEGAVEGDATVVLGSMEVAGQVDGDVTVVLGDLSLEEGTRIDGDVTLVGGTLSRGPDVDVRGQISNVDFGEVIDWSDIEWDLSDGDRHRSAGGWSEFAWRDLFYYLFELGFVAMLLFCTLFLAEPASRRVAARVRLEPWKAGLVGLLLQVATVLLTLLLTISCIGIPLVLLLAVAVAIFFLLGLAGVVLVLGDWLRERFSMRSAGAYTVALMGLVLVYGWMILGELLSWLPWPLRLIIVLTMIFGFLVKYCAWTIGLGAAALEQFAPLGGSGGAAAAGILPPTPPPTPPADEWTPRDASDPAFDPESIDPQESADAADPAWREEEWTPLPTREVDDQEWDTAGTESSEEFDEGWDEDPDAEAPRDNDLESGEPLDDERLDDEPRDEGPGTDALDDDLPDGDAPDDDTARR